MASWKRQKHSRTNLRLSAARGGEGLTQGARGPLGLRSCPDCGGGRTLHASGKSSHIHTVKRVKVSKIKGANPVGVETNERYVKSPCRMQSVTLGRLGTKDARGCPVKRHPGGAAQPEATLWSRHSASGAPASASEQPRRPGAQNRATTTWPWPAATCCRPPWGPSSE